MANRIAGITIEIDGNVTPLQKALQGVDKSLKTTQNNLKDVNRLLKMDPGNTDLLRQKQKLLTDAIKDTKSKLDTEKEALEQLKAADKTPEVTRQMEALERQIIEDEQKLKSLKQEMSDFGSVSAQKLKAAGDQMKEVGDKIKGVGDKITGLGNGITTHVTAPIMAVGGLAVASFNEVDEGLDTIIAKTGASGDALDDMQGILENIATSIPTDFATAGAAIGEVNTRFGVTGQELEDLSGKFIKFAELNGTDVSGSIDAVQAAMASFGVETSSAGDVLDILNKAGQDTGVSVDQLASNLLTNATALQEMGFGLNTSVGLLANLEKNGVDSSAVMTGLKKALSNATKEGKPMSEALSELQTSMENASTDTEAAQLAMELFGNKAGPAIAQAVQDGRLSFDELANTVTGFGDSVDTTFENTLDPIDRFKLTLNEAKLTGAEVGTTLMEILEPALIKVQDVVATLRDKWEALSPEQQDMITKMIMIAAVVGPVISIIGTLIGSIGSIITVGGTLVSGIGAVIGVLGGPLTLAIGGAIAAGIAIYKNWDKIKAGAAQLKENVNAAWDNIKTNISNAVGAARDAVSQKMEDMRNLAQTKLDAIKNAYSSAGGGIKGVIAATMEGVRQYFTTGYDVINNLTNGKLDAIKNKFSSVFSNVRNTVSGAINFIKGLFNFSWSLPHIKLPHFSISGSFSLVPPSVPHLSIAWYKKAYDDPFLFGAPTVMTTPFGLKGFGDGNGGELVYGRENLMKDIAAAAGDRTTNFYIYGDNKTAKQIAAEVESVLVRQRRQEARVYA